MTTLGVDGAVSVEDRAAECMTAIARAYEEGLAHLAFLQRVWETPPAPPVPALPVMTPVPAEPAEPEDLAEPAGQPVTALAEAETATDQEVVVLHPRSAPDESLDGSLDESPAASLEDGEPDREEPRVFVLSDAVTAEIPVQTAA